MNVLTHALLPALAAAPFLPRVTPREFYVSAGIVAVAGALPDLLHPHLSLAARYASWPHTLYALAGFSAGFLVLAAALRNRMPPTGASRLSRPGGTSAPRDRDASPPSWQEDKMRPARFALLLAPLAYASHLLLDGISGGIAWLYPFSREVVSHRLVRYVYWFPIDALLALTACVTVLWLRHRYWLASTSVAAAQPPANRDSN